MRVAVVTWTNEKIGGAESYLQRVLDALPASGYEVGFWHELEAAPGTPTLRLPGEVRSWSAARLGRADALAELRRWRPDLLYAHGLRTPDLEAATLDLAPAVFYAHNYYGTCIMGDKSCRRPTPRPCPRCFGPACLLHYYPRGCGGSRNPLTVWREYRRQAGRLHALRGYRLLLTASGHMRAEYLNHGFDPDRVRVVPYPVGHGPEDHPSPDNGHDDGPAAAPLSRLLFQGRMTNLKGGRLLLDALPKAAALLNRPLSVTFAGDGYARPEWEKWAAAVRARHPELAIHFAGWVTGAAQQRLVARADLLVVPSVWPEPFGLVGPEAGLRGVPATAFAVGGIPDWLEHGRNGFLAPGDPPTSEGLAAAIAACLRDPAVHARLRAGALEVARRFSLDHHLDGLRRAFADAVGQSSCRN